MWESKKFAVFENRSAEVERTHRQVYKGRVGGNTMRELVCRSD